MECQQRWKFDIWSLILDWKVTAGSAVFNEMFSDSFTPFLLLVLDFLSNYIVKGLWRRSVACYGLLNLDLYLCLGSRDGKMAWQALRTCPQIHYNRLVSWLPRRLTSCHCRTHRSAKHSNVIYSVLFFIFLLSFQLWHKPKCENTQRTGMFSVVLKSTTVFCKSIHTYLSCSYLAQLKYRPTCFWKCG